jgi:hypothetical protein
MMQQFVDNDSGYLDWISRNLDGFVVNSYRNPSPAYLVLHRTTCRIISGNPARGRQWTADYIKVCGGRAELESWARTHIGGALQPCRLCL